MSEVIEKLTHRSLEMRADGGLLKKQNLSQQITFKGWNKSKYQECHRRKCHSKEVLPEMLWSIESGNMSMR